MFLWKSQWFCYSIITLCSSSHILCIKQTCCCRLPWDDKMALFGKHRSCRGLAHATSNVIQKKYLILRLQSNSINLDLSLKKYYHPLCLCTTYHLDNGVEQAGNGIQDSFVYLYQTTPQAPKGCVGIMDVNGCFDCLRCKNINIVCNLPSRLWRRHFRLRSP